MKRPRQKCVITIEGENDDLSYKAKFSPSIDMKDESKNNECVTNLGLDCLNKIKHTLKLWSTVVEGKK